ncbi:ATP-binding cassette domain-containing protein [Bifidobacterium longum]|uniref:ABC transporter ATP-binding protein/permease n=1 Tax=Bifidobacterium longum TaxID=216816 RepID=UPI0004D5AD01|nr:ATP-binding cassette domain-containing protein [Bifidobacterium longum]KEY29588.1 ABC transporter ATP-binding protein [Bifidobacterium longum subsp. longum 72B]QHQ54319.1 ATP-binding cassette domain-containing protein [Bifidobacterium longum]RHA97862.1 ATP-binding cassette domain-containing protein [Bifidobacterium longum]TCF16735.1 ATP-binding and permeaase modules of ABC transporter system [Bifidobacterium longum subsp. longum]TCF91874.1 ATP-binding and permeaase modules of ABC transporte
MFDKRLFQLAPGLGKLIAGKVALMWVGLLANIGFMLSLVMLLQGLLAAADPHTFSCNAASASECPANLFGVPGTTVAPMAGDLMVYVALAIVCMLVRYLATTHATRLGTEAAERVKLALRSKLYRKMVALGPSYRSRVKTSDVVQSAGEGVEQIQSFFELFLPQLFYAILAPITLFAVIAPINMPAAVTMLVCAPLIIIVTGIVSMTAARAFKKYWGRYTDMGAAFLDNLQGLETLKNFDADDRAAAEMDKKAEGFRVMTMRVLQIQLRSLTAMDIVAYGGAAAGIGVALWQYAHTAAAAAGASAAGWSPIMLAAHLPGAFAYLAYGLQYLMPFGAGFPLTLAGLLLIVLLSAEFFIPMRQLGSYFHVAMNGMTSTKRIFALLDTPEPAHGTATLPATAGTDAGTDAGTKAGTKADGGITVSFDHVGYSYDSADSGAAVQQTNSAPAPALTDLTFTAYPGQLTAIVGISGSGKSTAAALLAGTLTGYQGSLTLNGVKVSDLSGETLARTITLIGASSHLFAGTLRENLLMALPDDGQNGEAASDAVDSRLWDALEQARIADFVRSQPDGLDMTIEPDAANLSGGQRQRIAIARALLHDSPVFVFDEATSSVDVESEELILATIRELVQSRSKTVIMITHRMANAEHADQVVVLEHGKSVETGTHAELMAAGGVYAKLFTTQADIENFGADHPQPASLTASASGSGAAVGAAPAAAPAEMSTFQVIKRLLGEAKPLAGLMVAASTAGTIGHLAATFLPVFGIIAGFALAGNPVWGMSAAGAITAMIVCAVLRGLTRYVEQYLNHNVAFHLLALFRSKAFAALRRLAPAKLAGKGKGDLIAMLTTDVELLEIFFAHTISPVAIAVTTTIVYVIVAATLSPWMALALIVSHLIIGIIVPRFFATGVRNLGPAIRGAAGELDNVMLDDMRGLDEIIRFGRGEDRAQAIEDRTRALWRDHAKLSRVNGRFAGVGGLLVALLTSAAAGIAINLAGVNLYDIPALVAAFALLASSFGPTLALAALPANLTQTFASARRLFGLMDEAPAVVETGTANSDYEGMRLDRVTFAYPGEGSEAILADFSLDVPQHGILGIQGPSGRGKSTMLKLLMRYWDPQRGQVTLSGTPLPQIDVHARRRIQAMMSQETHLFDGTIRENLLIALPESEIRNGGAAGVLDARLREALAKASVLDLIDSLPDGLDTQVGELGDRLSEGERQRIGLARVFLRNADLVLFDEPTSRLDALNEAIILRSIHELSKSEQNADKGQDVAVVLVSHRESAMRVADAVLNL